MKIQCIAAVAAARVIAAVSRLLGYQGVTWAGKAALRICPDILARLAGQVREEIFVVCGTNGKTTTNNLLCAGLEAEGKKVVCNHTGSNMLNGVAAAFVLSADLRGRLDADAACIEVDEASTRLVFEALKPDYMVLTNIFRDQLDRYGEIDITMEILESMIRKVPDMKLIVNGDDPLCSSLAMESRESFVTFGIPARQVTGKDPLPGGSGPASLAPAAEAAEKKDTYTRKTDTPGVAEETGPEGGLPRNEETREGRFCRRCCGRLSYRFYHFSQLGDYHCPTCGFKRPPADYAAGDVRIGEKLSFRVGEQYFLMEHGGFYQVYNILAAYAGIREAGIECRHFADMLAGYTPDNGRAEKFRIHGASVTLNLAKNPAGFNQNIAEVLRDPSPKDIFICINDHDQDGRDISWLWDVDFDLLRDPSVRSVTVGGTRALDMRLRLKYADIPCEVVGDDRTDIALMAAKGTGNIHILVNYTALYRTRNILKRMEAESR